jgi:hypothetical protein
MCGLESMMFSSDLPIDTLCRKLNVQNSEQLSEYVQAQIIPRMIEAATTSPLELRALSSYPIPGAALSPACTLERLHDKDFLSAPEMHTIINATANSPSRMLLYMVLGAADEALSMPELLKRCNELQGSSLSYEYAKNSKDVYRNFVQKWLVSAGLVTYVEGVGVGRGRIPSTYRMTDAGRAALPIVGALASWQIHHDEPIDTFTGRASTADPERNPDGHMYSQHTSRRLRIIQTALTHNTVNIDDVEPYMYRTRGNDALARLEAAGVLQCYNFTKPPRYSLRSEQYEAAANLLMALGSLDNETYATAARSTVYDILDSPELVRALLRPHQSARRAAPSPAA